MISFDKEGSYSSLWDRANSQIEIGLYSKYLHKDLKAKVKQFLKAPVDEQLSLFNELALTRSLALTHLEIFQRILEDPKTKDGSKQTATLLLQESLDNVRDMCAAAAKIQAMQKANINVAMLGIFVSQLVDSVKLVAERFLTEQQLEAMMVQLNDTVQEKVTIPEELRMTTLAPDDEARLMDATIPANPNDGNLFAKFMKG